jgi:hypothetical protein
MTRFAMILISMLVPFACHTSAGEKPAPPRGFTALFNGKDLSGWKATGNAKVWGVDNGLLYVNGGGGGWLMTEKEYGDFELTLEYRMPKMGNSGVGLRSPLEGDPAYVGMEIQLIDDPNWKGLQTWQHTGSIYNVVPAAKIATKPFGEWNKMDITCKGRHVKIVLNGEVLVDANLDDYVEQHAKKHPGILRKTGHIGLQSYNFRVDFRNIYLKAL